jgi:hypothetical protein
MEHGLAELSSVRPFGVEELMEDQEEEDMQMNFLSNLKAKKQ